MINPLKKSSSIFIQIRFSGLHTLRWVLCGQVHNILWNSSYFIGIHFVMNKETWMCWNSCFHAKAVSTSHVFKLLSVSCGLELFHLSKHYLRMGELSLSFLYLGHTDMQIVSLACSVAWFRPIVYLSYRKIDIDQ